ncbi:MAG TPA: transcriptional regulator [Ruminococcaceae bacterium]|nr:transcriptional regulator [Oscillospiraceae bacterium]
MKLIMAIVNRDDSGTVSRALTDGGFSVTKLATTGGFLKVGNTTFLIGADKDRVEQAIKIIAEHSQKRTQMMPDTSSYSSDFISLPIEVTVGGATVFVMDVERFEKL